MSLKTILRRALPLFAVLFLSLANAEAGSATWDLNPANGNWHAAANWTPATVPNGSSDVATFSTSNVTGITFSRPTTTVSEIVFNSAASAFTITAGPARTLSMTGPGVSNSASLEENFVTMSDATGLGLIAFTGDASAGSALNHYTCLGSTELAPGGVIEFHDRASASTATFRIAGGAATLSVPGLLTFFDDTTAAQATFVNEVATVDGPSSGGTTAFSGNSTAADGVFTNKGGLNQGGSTQFSQTANAGHGIFTSYPAASAMHNGGVTFFGFESSGAEGTFINYGARVEGAFGGNAFFTADSKAGNGRYINYGAAGATFVLASGRTEFFSRASAENSTLIAHGGTAGGLGAVINFAEDSLGGTAGVILDGNATLELGGHNAPGLTIGSLEGTGGMVSLGAHPLSIGSNARPSVFAGVIQDGGIGSGGSLVKIGPGVLSLSGASTFTGGTILREGSLVVLNTSGSALGTGAVQVEAGVLSGTGIITGPVTIGSGSGGGASLAPSFSTGRRQSLRLEGSLTFKGDGSFLATIRAQTGRANQVAARGVMIESGGTFFFANGGSGTIAPGTVLTLINNTASSPIAGVFSNLAEGATVANGSNTFLVSYEGGNGNDLTLTVTP